MVMFMKCPSHVINKIVQKTLESMQKNLFPDREDLYEVLVRSTWKFTDEGLEGISITHVKEGKLEEALKSAYKEMVYFSEVEGFEASIEVWGTWQELFEAMGMEIPSM